jgi:hypothetical protein
MVVAGLLQFLRGARQSARASEATDEAVEPCVEWTEADVVFAAVARQLELVRS